MSVIVCGDTHGTMDIEKLTEFFLDNPDYNKEDYLIIAGDTGICGFDEYNEADTRYFLDYLPITVLFVDGNHEHFDKLNDYPVEMWKGGKTHKITDNIRHLMRGQVFEIDGKKIFTFGGGLSIDKYMRVQGESWFPEEMPSDEEYEEGICNLEKHNWKVDYIVTHTGPREIVEDEMGYNGSISDEELPLRQYFSRVMQFTEFDAWYFGHFHEDRTIGTFNHLFYCLYDDVMELEDL